MKYEWRKKEKEIYLPPKKPQRIKIPSFQYFLVDGQGNPNDPLFGEYIGALYSVSYAIRMSYKNGFSPPDFYEYTVYPLEGFWDISEEAKKNYTGVIDKDSFVFKLMIRQPDFVTDSLAKEALERTLKKKPNKFLKKVKFCEIEEGESVQMMHLGSYDNEPETFRIMETFCQENNLVRKSKQHKEIYISDPRKVATEKLKTVLRFKVK